jgi:protein O-mannosyl-transferase
VIPAGKMADDFGGRPRLWLLVLCLGVMAVLTIYLQTASFGFVNYDDAIITRSNHQIERGLSTRTLERIFTPIGGAYQPLRDLAVEVVYEFNGLKPSGYHLFNLLLYLACLAAVFWLLTILLPLSSSRWPGGVRLWVSLGTLWYAVHPVHVEAVAWMNGNKELLSGMFYFLALGFYIRARGRGLLNVRYLAALLCFLLGMLSKPSVAAFPLVIVALELLFPAADRRIGRAVVRMVPYLVPTVLAALYFILKTTAVQDQWLQESMLIHMLSMASVLGRYLLNMAVPVNLCHSYPPPFFFGDYDWRLLIYLLLDISLLAGIWLAARRGARLVAFALLFFLLNLLPVSGLVPIAVFMADRYLFIPSLGLIVAALAGLAQLIQMRQAGVHPGVPAVVIAVMLLLLTGVSHQRCTHWKNSLSLWRSAVRTHGNFQFNHFGLANSYYRLRMPHKAKEAYTAANSFRDNLMCRYYLGRIEDSLGDSVAARQHFEQMERMFEPSMTGQMEEMAKVYRRLDKREKLAGHLMGWALRKARNTEFGLDTAEELNRLGYGERALELVDSLAAGSSDGAEIYLVAAGRFIKSGADQPASILLHKAHRNGADSLELVLTTADLSFGRGDWNAAVSGYGASVPAALGPDRLERLAAAYLNSGRKERALELFRLLAASRDGDEAAQLNNVGVVLEAMDSLDEAQAQFLAALKLDSVYADAWYNLGRVRTALGKYNIALESFYKVRSLESPDADIELVIARLLVRLERPDQAVAAYARAAELAPQSSAVLLEAADTAWSLGAKALAEDCYERLKALPDSASLPPRVRNRTFR